MRVCPKCWDLSSPDAVECESCGYRLIGTKPPPSQVRRNGWPLVCIREAEVGECDE